MHGLSLGGMHRANSNKCGVAAAPHKKCKWARQHLETPVRRISETLATTTSQKSIAIHLQFVLQYASNLYCNAFGATGLSGKGTTSVLLPFVSQYASHLYRNTPPICIAILLGKSWWLWSPGCSPPLLSRTHPSRHAIFFRPKSAQKQPEMITSYDVLEAFKKQAPLASRDDNS